MGALTAYLGVHLSQARQDRIESRDAAQLQVGVQLMSHDLERSLQQLQGLEQEPALHRAFAAPPALARTQVQEMLQALLYRNAPYAKARWIGPDGMERVRVDRVGTQVEPVAQGQLQDKSDRPYFTQAIRLSPGQFYLSAMDLNVEHGQIEVPYRPTIRAAIRLPTVKGVDQGLLVVNLAVQHLLDDYADISSATQGGKRMLLDSQGRWLLAPDPQDAWGHLFGRDNSLAKRQPWAWQQMTDQPSGRLQDASGLWIWNSVDPAKLWPGQIQAAEHWKLVSHLDRDLIQLLWWQGWPLLFLNAGVMLLLLAFGVRRYAKLLSAHDATAAELEAAYQLQQSAAELQKSHDLLSMAEEGAGAGFWDWDMALGPDRMNWSKQTFRLFGLDPATASASLEAWRRAVHPDDLPLAETRIEEAFRERRHYAVSYRVILPDGAIRWIDAFGKVSYDDVGAPPLLLSMAADNEISKIDGIMPMSSRNRDSKLTSNSP